VKYRNNVVEAAHGKLKQLIRSVRGFKTLKIVCAPIFNITRDIGGEVRIVERAFGLGVSAIAEAVHFVSERLRLEAA
jgi:hypothetical protein